MRIRPDGCVRLFRVAFPAHFFKYWVKWTRVHETSIRVAIPSAQDISEVLAAKHCKHGGMAW